MWIYFHALFQVLFHTGTFCHHMHEDDWFLHRWSFVPCFVNDGTRKQCVKTKLPDFSLTFLKKISNFFMTTNKIILNLCST